MGLLEQAPFDAFEIQKVAEFNKGHDNAYCEPIANEGDQYYADQEASTQFWTVYGHRTGFGVFAIADLGTHQAAIELATALSRTGEVPIHDNAYAAEEVPA
jgi:hypothetical protein